ncbi:MAG TPA: alpha/beta hydrolase domain-containing protein [Steroidobacteraceae bacterium]|nr:alpha/beta hydrolase domain-containing protein [Steroidobacteraceae bacterium]
MRSAPHGQHGFPFLSTVLDLGTVGYVEEEFLISGTAQAYISLTPGPLQPNGRWDSQPNPGVTAPYATRMLVRRPLDPARFNGVVVVEWLNESGGSDATADWWYMRDEIVRQGYAYVGVTVQWPGVQSLLGWETGPGARYATLFHPGESFDYNIFAQAGWVVAHPRNGDPRPLGTLTDHVRDVVGTGFSQSAWWLATYINAIHPLTPVYDGFLVHDGGIDQPLSWPGASLFGDPIPAGVPATPEIDTPYPFQLRTDQSVPVLVVGSEFGLSDFGNAAGRSFHLQPDSSHIRFWELAGATHLESGWFQQLVADNNKSIPGSALDPCDGPPGIPSVVHGQAARAALNALSSWISDGQAPALAPRLSLFVPTPADDFDQLVVFNRDPRTNLAIGGIRLPAVAVPTATLNGNRSDLDPSTLGPGGQCYFVGAFDPWDHDSDPWDGQVGFDPSPTPEPDLQLLYSTHQRYVQQVASAALQSIRGGYLRPIDGAKIVLDAAQSKVP